MFIMSKGLSCLVFVCQGFVVSSVCLSRISYGTVLAYTYIIIQHIKVDSQVGVRCSRTPIGKFDQTISDEMIENLLFNVFFYN